MTKHPSMAPKNERFILNCWQINTFFVEIKEKSQRIFARPAGK
jgi:hypothetical protein